MRSRCAKASERAPSRRPRALATRVAPYVAPDVDPELERAPEQSPTRLYRVSVDVRFPAANGRERSLSLSTRASWPRRQSAMSVRRHTARGFTLVELMIALVLLALMRPCCSARCASPAAAGRGRSEGESHVRHAARAGDSCARNLEEQHPQRMRKIVEFPLLFAGERDELRYAAALPARVGRRRHLVLPARASPVATSKRSRARARAR